MGEIRRRQEEEVTGRQGRGRPEGGGGWAFFQVGKQWLYQPARATANKAAEEKRSEYIALGGEEMSNQT
eukprot:749853-Hanusia_phi.AAC.4